LLLAITSLIFKAFEGDGLHAFVRVNHSGFHVEVGVGFLDFGLSVLIRHFVRKGLALILTEF